MGRVHKPIAAIQTQQVTLWYYPVGVVELGPAHEAIIWAPQGNTAKVESLAQGSNSGT